jgi:hypothetical protein
MRVLLFFLLILLVFECIYFRFHTVCEFSTKKKPIHKYSPLNMSIRLNALDTGVLIGYFVVVIGFGIWVSSHQHVLIRPKTLCTN